MKITQTKGFTPITITLETYEEAQELLIVCGCVVGAKHGTQKIYNELRKIGVSYEADNEPRGSIDLN